jgi:hypothetical protein
MRAAANVASIEREYGLISEPISFVHRTRMAMGVALQLRTTGEFLSHHRPLYSAARSERTELGEGCRASRVPVRSTPSPTSIQCGWRPRVAKEGAQSNEHLLLASRIDAGLSWASLTHLSPVTRLRGATQLENSCSYLEKGKIHRNPS